MSPEYVQLILDGLKDTLFMVILSTVFSYVIGLPLGVLLNISYKDGIKENQSLYKVLDIIVNVLRSIPFLILILLVMPLTKLIVGKTYGPAGTIVPLVIGAAPFVARMVEGSLNELPAGVIEAAKSMGMTNFQIITKVMIPETLSSLITGFTIATATILGYSAIAGAIGGGGLGDIAIQYGYYRGEKTVMYICIVILIALVQIVQVLGTLISKKVDKR